MTLLAESFAAGYACLGGRADLLDRINVFPVADGDTGANLRVSLAPLRGLGQDRTATAARLVRTAMGNSGNIAVAFFNPLILATTPADLPARAQEGRAQAWRAVAAPQAGTMLDVFDVLAEVLHRMPIDREHCPALLAALAEAVARTAVTLPDLRQAGVVDAGALGMFLVFDGLFRTLCDCDTGRQSLFDLFAGRLVVAADYHQQPSAAHCVDVVLRPPAGHGLDQATLAGLGDSLIMLPDEDRVKIHVHTADPAGLRTRMGQLGEVVAWTHEPITVENASHKLPTLNQGGVHLITDAAGSLPRDLARQHDITLLDSYVVTADGARPETLCDPVSIYDRMRRGERVTTAQASRAERHELYRGLCEQFGRTLYLAVGSVYTGNHAAALAWKREHDPEDLMTVIDTGAASGRLALIVLLTARCAGRTDRTPAVVARAHQLCERCREYVFLDTLRYLAAGGRISRASGFFGDLLHCKPVITPAPEGARRVGMVRTQAAQVEFALERMSSELDRNRPAVLLLQYADNRDRVEGQILPRLRAALPLAEILLAPLSLTSGVHMGPGAWALAFAQED